MLIERVDWRRVRASRRWNVSHGDRGYKTIDPQNYTSYKNQNS